MLLIIYGLQSIMSKNIDVIVGRLAE